MLYWHIKLAGVLLTVAGVVEEIGSRKKPLRRRQGEGRAPGLSQRVVYLLLQNLLGELRLRVKEDQLPPPPSPHPWTRNILVVKRVRKINMLLYIVIKCVLLINYSFM